MPSKVFLVTELLEMILLAFDTRTLLLSQRVFRRWRGLIQDSHYLRAALFLEPVRYQLPHGVQGIRNPLIEEYLWPWLRAKKTRMGWQPPLDEGQPIPQIGPEFDKYFVNRRASWLNMLFQQPPRSCVGVVEMDSQIDGTPAYTEFKAKKILRVKDVLKYHDACTHRYYHPLSDEGIFWYGPLFKFGKPGYPCPTREFFRSNGELKRDVLEHARNTYLRDCDVVLFTNDARYARGDYINASSTAMNLNRWLLDVLDASMVPGQTFIPMPVT